MFGQVNMANLTGAVRDQSGAAVPGAALTLTNTGTPSGGRNFGSWVC